MKKKFKCIIFFLMLFLIMIIMMSNKIVFAAQTSGLSSNKVYHIINKASGKCINVNYGTDANGTNVNQYTKDGSIEQYFKLVYNSSRDSYKLYSMCSSYGGNRVIDIYRPIQAGANIDIWTPDDNDAQDLIIINRGNGYYSLHPRYNTSLAITSYGTGNGGGSGTSSTSTGNVFVTTYSGSDNQLWAMKTGAMCHYHIETGMDRTPTHTWTKYYTERMGYSYYSRLNNSSSTNFLNDLRNNEIYVWQGHGNSGILAYTRENALISSNSITGLPSNSLSNLKIAVIYSCNSGSTPTGGTSIVDAISGRGALCTVGWDTTIHMSDAMKWNELFWEKIYSENESIVEGFRHADYWIQYEYGSESYNIMSGHRVERGNIYQYL